MKHEYFFSRILLSFIMGIFLPSFAYAYVDGGTIEIAVGKSAQLSVERSSYYTVSGYWKKEGNSCYFSSRSQRSCTVTGSQPGTTTIIWKGIIGFSDQEWRWTIKVGESKPIPSTPNELNDGDSFWYEYNGTNVQYEVISAKNKTCQVGAVEIFYLDEYSFTVGGQAVSKSLIRNSLTIPETANGYKVVEVCEYAFNGCESIKSITLPNTITKIGECAFFRCSSLTSFIIPDNVKEIGNGAFAACKSLQEITIGKGVEVIDCSFYSSRQLRKITIKTSTPPYLDSEAFEAGVFNDAFLYVPAGSLEEYKKTEVWKKFENIFEIGNEPEINFEINETYFPDENFRKYLINEGYKTGEDIVKVKSLYLRRKSIKSLKGIEYFTSLTSLDCRENQLTSIDLSKNTELRELLFYGNNIRDEGMDALINSLPVVPTNDGVFEVVSVTYMGQYVCKCTKSQVAAAKAKGWIPCMEYGIEYEGSTDPDPSAINETNFPDDNFRNYLLNEGYKTEEDIKDVSYLDLSSKNIKSLKGIEYFTALHTLYCNQNQLTTLDVSNNSALSTLWCSDNQLTALDVSKNTALKELNCHDNQLSALDVSRNNNLETLRVWGNRIFGNAMNNLINSLPFNSTNKEHIIYIISGLSDEENVCTTTQVSEIKKKGWIPTERHGFEIEGSDPTGIMSRISETKETPIYNLNGQRMDKPHKGINIIGGKKVVIK